MESTSSRRPKRMESVQVGTPQTKPPDPSSSSTASRDHIPLDQTQRSTVRAVPVISGAPDSLNLVTQQSLIRICSTQSVTGPSNATPQTATSMCRVGTSNGVGSFCFGLCESRFQNGERNSSMSTGVNSTSKKIRSKYKFLPGPLFAATSLSENADGERPDAGKKSKTAHHTQKCRVFNRFKHVPTPLTRSASNATTKISGKGRGVQVGPHSPSHHYHGPSRQKKLITDCRCEERTCSCMDRVSFTSSLVFRFVSRLTSLLCCPPSRPASSQGFAFMAAYNTSF